MQTILPRWRFKTPLSPQYLVAVILLLLGVVGAFGLLTAIKEKRNLTSVLVEEGTALAETLEVSSRNALVANRLLEQTIAQRLLDNARLFDRILQGDMVHPRQLADLAQQNQLDRIELRDAQGELLTAFPLPGGAAAMHPMMGPAMRRRHMGMMGPGGAMHAPGHAMRPHHFYHPILEGKAAEALEGFGAHQFWLGEKYGVAVKRQFAPGIIVITAAADLILEFRKQIGLQRLLKELQSPHIAYISIQDTNATFVAHSDARLVGTGADDPYVMTVAAGGGRGSRIRTIDDDRQVLEIVRSFSFEGKPLGVLRVGLSMHHVEHVWRQALMALLLSGGAVLAVGAIGEGVILANQAAHFRRVHELERVMTRQERLAALGHLAAEVAHEVRNPLNAISMGLQRLQREFSPAETAARQEFSAITVVVRDEVKRLNQTIENFLKMARPIKLHRQVWYLDELLKELGTLLKEETHTRDIQWQVHAPPRLPPLFADRDQLRQALLNLILNALQATPPGGRVSLQVEATDDRLWLHLHDTGNGIKPEAVERIFDPYYTTKEGGTGLGLAIAQKIVQAHGGHIEVTSTLGQGSTFTVWLPLTHDQDV